MRSSSLNYMSVEELLYLRDEEIGKLMMPTELHVGRDGLDSVQAAPYNDHHDPDTKGMWNGVVTPILT